MLDITIPAVELELYDERTGQFIDVNIKETTLILGNGFLGKEFIRQGYKHFTTSEQLRFKTPKEYECVSDDIPVPIQFLGKLEIIIDY